MPLSRASDYMYNLVHNDNKAGLYSSVDFSAGSRQYSNTLSNQERPNYLSSAVQMSGTRELSMATLRLDTLVQDKNDN